jgi:hypothetical protein
LLKLKRLSTRMTTRLPLPPKKRRMIKQLIQRQKLQKPTRKKLKVTRRHNLQLNSKSQLAK